MKKLYQRLIITALLLAVLPVFPTFSVMADGGERLSVNKATFEVGEPILVTATGAGADWVGLYLATDVPGQAPSIWWYYVARDGHTSGDEVDLLNATYVNTDRPELIDVPAGEYKVILLANDGYAVIEEVAITVKGDPPVVPKAPESAVYTSAGAGEGRADGTVTITAGEVVPQAYALWWANADGPMEGYTQLAKVKSDGTETVYTLRPDTLVPVGADRILVYAVNGALQSDTVAVAMLPEGAGDYELGEPLYELQVMSDIHINESAGHTYNRQFAAALAEIQRLSPDSLGVFLNGDIADHGAQAEYDQYMSILRAAGDKCPPVYAAIGNHDFFSAGTDAERIERFLKGTGNDSETIYFDRWIDGVHFVFLGSEWHQSPNAQFSDEQLSWLEATLAEDKVEGRPIYVFLHEGILDTVAGTFGYQGWHGVARPDELKAILSQHKEVVLFSGHSHWVLESEKSFKPADDKLPAVLNTASCAYLWDDAANLTNVGINGSQGYYIYAYEDRVLFRGRSFSEGKWISSVQFVMACDIDMPKVPEETEPVTEPTTAPETAPDTPAESTDVGTSTGPVVTEPVSSESAPVATAPQATEAESADGTGCASAVTAFGAAGTLLSLAGAAYVLRWTKQHNGKSATAIE